MTINQESSTWKTEISSYIPHLQALPVRIDKALSALSSLGVTAPIDRDIGVRNILMIQLILFNIGSVRVARNLAAAAEMLFREGMITSTCLQLRLLFEYWGAIAFASAHCDKVRDAVNLEDAATLEGIVVPIGRLIGGSRIPVKLPWGGETNTKSYNIMKFIEHLEKCEPGVAQEYDFLCEACHPSFIQQDYFWMAGNTGDNWTNKKFHAHAHALLERLILVGEKATLGLTKSTEHLVKISRPFVVDPK